MREQFTEVDEMEAQRRLIAFLQVDADVDDLARLFSLVLCGGMVVVKGIEENSFTYRDGELA